MEWSLKAEAVKGLFAGAPNDAKLDFVGSLCASVPHMEFLNHDIVLSQMKKRLCDLIDEVMDKAGRDRQLQRVTVDDAYQLKYLFTHSRYHFHELCQWMDYGFLEDMMRYVHPTTWTHYRIDQDQMHISRRPDNENEWRLLDFQRDIIEARFPPEKIVKRWNDGSTVEWHAF